jgi:hypothetical protein
VGDEVTFSVHVYRPGDDIWPGPRFMLYEDFIRLDHLEAFLNGKPPEGKLALDEFVAIDSPTRQPRPRLRASWPAYWVEFIKWKFH